MDRSDRTFENGSKRPGFLFRNSTMCGEGSSSQASNGNGISSKARRKMIDLQLPADEYLDMDETRDSPPYNLFKSGKEDASGSCLDLNNTYALADLNEPASEPVALSRDTYSRHSEIKSQNARIVLQAGHDRSGHMPSHFVQVLSNSAFQHQSYPTTHHSNVRFPGERSYNELEVRSKNPQDSYMESSVASNVSRPWSHSSSPWENPMSSSHYKPYPEQMNPFMNHGTRPRAETSRVSNGHYQGLFSSGFNESLFNLSSASVRSKASLGEVVKSHQRFESLQRPKKQECSASLPWLKPKPLCRSETSNVCFDLNASADQLMDNASPPQNGSCSIKANTVKLDLDINLPCDASVSLEGNKAGNFRHSFDLNSCATEDDEGFGLHYSLRVETKAKTLIDLEALPTSESEEEEEEAENLEEKANEQTRGQDELVEIAAQAIVAISLSNHPDDAASSSTDAAVKTSLSWFADIIIDELERKLDCEGYSSGEIDYFEAKTLSLQQVKEEDYMPEPLVPESLNFEGAGFSQLRRGQARRGRPKRDFQRDILPGLLSLSRHEVIEDIQTFGGVTKARDYSLSSGVAARRNSKRKRPVAEPTTNESMSVVVGFEETKLTGWGKTTRRPRRQRCPAATVILT